MKHFRHLLLVVLLFCSQLAAAAHAVEHFAAEESGLPPGHVCELCLAAHDLGAGLVGIPSLPPPVDLVLVPVSRSLPGREFLLPPRARQGAPPVA